MVHKSLSIIIVSYNTKELTLEALASVFVSTQELKLDVIIVDNNSTDGSVAAIRKQFGKRVELIENTENVGFAKANNQGLAIAKGEYLLLLNSDVIVHAQALDHMVSALEKNHLFGVISCMLVNKDGTYQPQGGALPNLFNIAWWWLWPFPGTPPLIAAYQDRREPKGEVLVERGWVGGTAMMMRREAYKRMGGLDEQIFMYAEDIDYCIRVHHDGYRIGILPTAFITHLGSASGSSQKAKLGEVRGILYLFSKYKPLWQRVWVRLIFIKGSLLRYLLFGILKRRSDARRFYRDVLSLAIKPL